MILFRHLHVWLSTASRDCVWHSWWTFKKLKDWWRSQRTPTPASSPCTVASTPAPAWGPALCSLCQWLAYISPASSQASLERQGLEKEEKRYGASPGASLLVQWLRIHLPMQEPWFPDQGTKIPHTVKCSQKIKNKQQKSTYLGLPLTPA